MYFMDKYKDRIDEAVSFIPYLLFTPVIIWILNGGKNDFGIIHRLAIYLAITGLIMTVLMLFIFILLALCDFFIWLYNLYKT